MKINFIMPGLGDSGGIKVVRRYASMMNDRGIDVIVYSPIKAYNFHRYTSSIKNKMHQIYCTFKTILTMLQHDKPEIKWVWSINNKTIRDADKVIATAWVTAYDIMELDKRKGEKWYFIQDFEIWDNYDYGVKSYTLPLKKIVISNRINNELKNNLGIGPFPVIFNGIDTNIFKKEQKKYEKKDMVFLMLNHTLEKKGVKQGLKVFEKVRKSFPDVKLVMFGMCSSSNLPNYVEYVQNPTVNQLVDLYNMADIFIFPSLEEGWGLTPLEAMACGCAVVATKTGFVIDLGENGKNMMISEPGDIQGMVDNIFYMLQKDNLEKISIEGYKLASSLSWTRACQKFIDCLELKDE